MKQNKQNSNYLMNGLYMQYTILQKNKQGGGGGGERFEDMEFPGVLRK